MRWRSDGVGDGSLGTEKLDPRGRDGEDASYHDGDEPFWWDPPAFHVLELSEQGGLQQGLGGCAAVMLDWGGRALALNLQVTEAYPTPGPAHLLPESAQ